ncbi:MAG: ACT domain-containing protein [Lachnospiraceae bacterium]|nr:ACT domain-containing protein [Candidatus Colinaster equi]
MVKQLTVFIENRVGTLEEVTKVLSENNINIFSLSLADTSEYGLLRMIVASPEEAKKLLRDAGFSAKVTDVVAVRLENKVGTLAKLFDTISASNVSIEYMYAMATSKVGAIIIKVSDADTTIDVLKKNDFMVLDQESMYELN